MGRSPAKVQRHHEYGFSTLKSGKPGRSWVWKASTLFCPIERCSVCGKWGSETWVKCWGQEPWPPLCERRDDWEYQHERARCIGCFNKVRPLWNSMRQIWENNRMIRKIQKEAGHANSNRG